MLKNILAGGVVLIAIIAGAFIYFTDDPVETQERFFAAIQDHDMEAAFELLSPELKQLTNEQELAEFVQSNALNSVQSANWYSSRISDAKIEMSGDLTTVNGRVLPVRMMMINLNDQWQINELRISAGGNQSVDGKPDFSMPQSATLIELAKSSVQQFALAVNAKSMVGFHPQIARVWQNQFNVEDLDNAYKAFYDANVDLTVLDNLIPRFSSEPSIDDNGILLLSGLFPTKPSQFTFTQKYIYEGLRWKLVGFSADIK